MVRKLLFALMICLSNLAAILAGYGLFHMLRSFGIHLDQRLVQVPAAVLINAAAARALPLSMINNLVEGRGISLRWVGGIVIASLVWTPVVFYPVHFLTQGYLADFTNILWIWVYQLPTNLMITYTISLRWGNFAKS